MDIMIAGQAINRGLILVSRDQHFKRVEGLTLEFYSDQDQ
jgi:predicted nucleic acid-binding protein